MPEDVFERFAEEYDRWFEEHRAEYHAELARVRRLFPRPDSRAVEVGVGSGRFAAPLGITLGLEPSLALARMARGRGIEVIRGRGEAIPIRDGSCSSVLMVTVICFLDDPVLVFRELHRILVPGGTLVLGFIEREGEIAPKYLHERGKLRFLSRARFYASGEVRHLLGCTGFRVATIDSRAGFSVIAARKDCRDPCASR
ncbi:class I SAM-dependent methyltransferase [Methanoculleus sp. 7T]|uniref:class I SAM-dependent methyltransferase n=1 Tax=Methanoculleus sp. 7T TaxID=2937282 RepID=UPI0020C0759F|nr:class I SAM-dependent methyltransferase [Methanoculleus sp. 7T]MCK8517665.1 class I SAM-dependent methyltransferase [Methanoculleus sp. 7T]